MKRKDINRSRRDWEELASDLHHNKRIADWARQWAPFLLSEVARLRDLLRLSEQKRRGAYTKLDQEIDSLELGRVDLDNLIDQIESLRDSVAQNATGELSSWWLGERLNEILSPYMDSHHENEDA